jgi:hypothetical protein
MHHTCPACGIPDPYCVCKFKTEDCPRCGRPKSTDGSVVCKECEKNFITERVYKTQSTYSCPSCGSSLTSVADEKKGICGTCHHTWWLDGTLIIECNCAKCTQKRSKWSDCQRCGAPEGGINFFEGKLLCTNCYGSLSDPLPVVDDSVNHPKHYTQGKIEVIEFILDQKLGPLEANVVKYICRAKHKGKELADLKKAEWYIKKAISEYEKNNKEEK